MGIEPMNNYFEDRRIAIVLQTLSKTGLEPITFTLSIWRSNQLSYLL